MLDKYLLPEQEIVGRIHVLRYQKVMLDYDLALLYEIPTKRINEQVKRNKDRFPTDFMFQLTKIEWNELRPQILKCEETHHTLSQSMVFSCFQVF